MKKISLILIISLLCGIFAACNTADGEPTATPDSRPVTDVSEGELEANTEVSSQTPIEDDTETSQTPQPAEPDVPDEPFRGYIDYTLSSYGFNPPDDNPSDTVFMFKSEEELHEFYKEEGIAVTDAFEAEFFEEKAVLFIPMIRGSGSIELSIRHIYVDGSKLTVTMSEYHPEVQTDDMQYKLFTVEIDQSYLEDVTEAKLICERQFYSSRPSGEKGLTGSEAEYTIYDVDGYIDSSRGTGFTGSSFNRLEIIRNTYEFDELLERYTPEDDEADTDEIYLTDFAKDNNNDEYFKDKMFVVMHYSTDFDGTKFGFTELLYNDNYTYFCMYHDNSEIAGFDDNSGIMIIEFSKEIVSDDLQFVVEFEYTNYRFDNSNKSVDFTAKYFTGCHEYDHDHGNAANNDYFYSMSVYSAERVEWMKEGLCDCGVDDSEFIEYLDSLDEEFFKDKAIIVSFVRTDPGENIEIARVRHDDKGYHKILTIIDHDDSVTPSSDDNLECQIAVAIIDKMELLGYPGISCRVD